LTSCELALGGELDAPQDRHPGHGRRGAALGRGPDLVEHVVVADVLAVQRDGRVVPLEGGRELVPVALGDVGRRLGRADRPVGDVAFGRLGDDLVELGGGVDLDRAGQRLDRLGVPLRGVDAGLLGGVLEEGEGVAGEQAGGGQTGGRGQQPAAGQGGRGEVAGGRHRRFSSVLIGERARPAGRAGSRAGDRRGRRS